MDKLNVTQIGLMPASHGLANVLGADRYFTGRPCKRGHLSERYTRGGACVECVNPGSRGKLHISAESSSALGALADELEQTKIRYSEQFAARMADLERDHAKSKRELREALLDANLPVRRRGEIRLRILELDEEHKGRCMELHDEAKREALRLRAEFDLKALALRNAAVTVAAKSVQTDEERHVAESMWRSAQADLQRATRRVEKALLAFHKKSSLFATSASGSQANRAGKGDGNHRLSLYEEVQLQVKYARKVAELDPNGTNWTRAFHEHHAATAQLAIERVLPWRIDEHGNMPPTREVEQSLERLRALRAAKVKAERIMRARMPDPVVFPAPLFDDVGEIRDVMQEGARFNLVMRFLDAEVARPTPPPPQLTEKPADDMMERIRAYQASRVPRMEPK